MTLVSVGMYCMCIHVFRLDLTRCNHRKSEYDFKPVCYKIIPPSVFYNIEMKIQVCRVWTTTTLKANTKSNTKRSYKFGVSSPKQHNVFLIFFYFSSHCQSSKVVLKGPDFRSSECKDVRIFL